MHVAKSEAKILASIREAQNTLADCAKILGMLCVCAPDDIVKDVRTVSTAVGLAVKQVTLAKLLLEDKEKRDNG